MKASNGLGASLVMAAVLAMACGQGETAPPPEPVPAKLDRTRQEVRGSNKVLILGSSVSGGSSSTEAQAVATLEPGWAIDVVTPTKWQGMTAEQFGSYRAIIIGDADCTSGTAAFQAAIDTRTIWGDIVDGDIVIVGTNLSSGSKPLLTRDGIEHVLRSSEQDRTGLYVSLGCAYQHAPADTAVTLLERFGDFRIQGSATSCAATAGHLLEMSPLNVSHFVDDAYLGSGGCAARSVFTTYPFKNFSVAAIGLDTAPYILVRDTTPEGSGYSNDLPAIEGSPPMALCTNVTVSAPSNACGAAASINNGSSDPDGDLVGCTQSPAGPYNLGNTTVTLTCTDSRNQTASCSGVVTVRDVTPPTVTVGTPNRTVQCNRTASYVDLSDLTATDLCSNPVTLLARTGTVSLGVIGTYTLTYPARDAVGNTGSATRTVSVIDTAAPTISLNIPTTVTLECGSTYNEPGFNTTDTCYGNLNGSVVVSGSVSSREVGTYPLRYDLTDPSGNAATTRLRTVNVQDTLRPVVTILGPLTQTVECNDPTYQDPGATATDACAGALPVTPVPVPNVGLLGAQSINYRATDPAGNVGTSSTNRMLSVLDTLPPAVTLNGSATMSLECSTPFQDPGATASDQCAGNLTSVIQRTGSVNHLQPGPYSLRYSVTDTTGHSDSKNRVVTVRDTLAPNITVLGALTASLECGSTYVDPGATATDACSGAVPVMANQSGNPGQPGIFTISYSATDASGNIGTSQVVRTVQVNDSTPPALALFGSSTPTLQCGTPYSDPGATANDVCFGDLTGSIVRTGAVNHTVVGTYPLRYTVTDPAGQSTSSTRTVNVRDLLSPSLTVLGPLSQQFQCGSGPYADPGATASDLCDGDLTGAIQRVGNVDPGTSGSYTLTYGVSDRAGNVASSQSRQVTVVDTLPPSLSLVGPANGTHECGSPYADPGATATDLCSGDLTAGIVRQGSVNGRTPGSYALSYTVTDRSNLTASAQRQVTVSDTLAPVLALAGPATQNVECGPGYRDPGATATDACAGNLDAQIVVTGAASSTVVGDYNVRYAVSDNAGNAATPLNRQVRVRDTVAPTITVNGPVEQRLECGNTYVDPGASATDVCAGTVAVTATRTGSSTTPGTFTITYSATDPSGNSVTSPVVRTVRVSDDTPPTLVLVGPATQTLECTTPWSDPGATASDVCFGDLTAAITRSGNVNSGAPGSYPIIYNVMDGAGNSAPSTVRLVQVRDTIRPAITVLGPLTQSYECGTPYQDPGATATDSCAGNLTSAIVATRTSDPNAPANFTITYSVADPSGNTTVSPATRRVTVNDNTPPSITLNGQANEVLECNRGVYNDPGATATDLCVGSVPVTVTGSVNMSVRGAYTLRYSARDTAGNVSPTLTRNVAVTDTLGPVISLNGPNTVRLECSVDTYAELGATADDICSGPAAVTVDASAVNPQVLGSYLVRYTASDASGNPTSTTRNVLVEDALPPIITLNGPNPMVMECATQFQDPGATATDLCQGDVTGSVSVELTNVNALVEGTYSVQYTANDGYGNVARLARSVEVRDTIGPVLTVTGAPSAQVECGSQPELGVRATDACYGILPSSAITTSPAALPNVPGEYDVTYSATDLAGNTTVGGATRHFTVVDTGVPEVVVNGPVEQYYECTGHVIGNLWSNPGASATDLCEGELLVHQYNSGDDDGDGVPGDQDPDDWGPGPTTEVEGVYNVQYLAWDESYNLSGAVLTVYVEDTLKPTLTLNGEEFIQTQCFTPTDDPRDPDEEIEVDPEPFIDPGATGNDQCYGDVTPSVMTFGEVNKQAPGVYTVEYQVRDGAFNWADPITRTVEVIDNLAPILKENDPLQLSPPDNTMRVVELSQCAIPWDLCEGYMDIDAQAFDLTITSNDPNMSPSDVRILTGSKFEVRSRNNVDGSGRVYTATYMISDSSGNVVQGECTLNVTAGFRAGR